MKNTSTFVCGVKIISGWTIMSSGFVYENNVLLFLLLLKSENARQQPEKNGADK